MNAQRPLTSADEENRRLDALIAALPPCPGLPETPEEIAAADARAEADIAAGRTYPPAVIAQWLESWRDGEYRPFKDWLADRDG